MLYVKPKSKSASVEYLSFDHCISCSIKSWGRNPCVFKVVSDVVSSCGNSFLPKKCFVLVQNELSSVICLRALMTADREVTRDSPRSGLDIFLNK